MREAAGRQEELLPDPLSCYFQRHVSVCDSKNSGIPGGENPVFGFGFKYILELLFFMGVYLKLRISPALG